uniref:U2 small nuclear RNA auxiliary factor 1 n=1 Tax=Oryzias latipes TaxID=8090 RepID=A0A3P9HWX2_ORYLA
MAEYLASIFGTEKDKVNCSFYFKIGACRHGDRCSRLHNKPTFSQEVFTEMEEKYGEVEEMNVCDNLGDHLVGNVYVKFRREEDAEKAVMDLNNRWFNGQPIHAELSPVTDFREACCRQYEMGCTAAAGKGAAALQTPPPPPPPIQRITAVLFSRQAPLSFTLPRTALPFQGSTTGPREEEVEGPRTLWKVLGENRIDPPTPPQPPPLPPPNTAVTTKFSFVFLGELLEVFVSFIPFFKTSLCRFLNKTDLQLCTEHQSHFTEAEGSSQEEVTTFRSKVPRRLFIYTLFQAAFFHLLLIHIDLNKETLRN